MAVRAEVQAGPRAVYGFVYLALLVLAIGGLATGLTVYLLRLQVSTPTPLVSPPPAPYRVLVMREGRLWSEGTGGSRQVLIAGVSSPIKRLVVAPDGSGLLAVAASGAGDTLLLRRSPGSPPEVLPLADVRSAPGPWQVTDVVWVGTRDVVALATRPGPGSMGILTRYSVDASPAHIESRLTLRPRAATLMSLAPDAAEVASVETAPPTGGFAGQVQVRLRRLAGARTSVALHYLGTAPPAFIAWSLDGGTLAIAVPGQGLAIQKSSGRSVRVAGQGMAPAAFSPRGAAVAYLGSGGRQIRLLNLHGEVDHLLAVPSPATPDFLAWTPDARALIYGAGGGAWQIDPVTGQALRLPGSWLGSLVGVVPAGSRFGP